MPDPTAPAEARVERIGPHLELAAAQRLTGTGGARAGRRLLSAAAMHGLDVSLMWGAMDRTGRTPRVRQVCLAVPGAGRTAMVMLSGPDPSCGTPAEQRADRVACTNLACRYVGRERTPPVKLAQALPEPAENWAIEALDAAGFVHVGELEYLRRPLPGPSLGRAPAGDWPPGVEVRNVRDLTEAGPDRAALIEAMERSYIDTLDCPELCGLRETQDVLESHRATGQWSPDLWWVVVRDGQPAGCLLLTHCPEQSSVELVYLGLSPELRGKGLARRLLSMGLSRVLALTASHVSCAVDTRNVPALHLYRSLGFVRVTSRIGMVRPL
ncbi:MAG: GNAT family N-acetyltransferase [Phycisphaerales bacterium]|nr:GNAT family N-acetyltransferase [Phycisphaerales bacterium]